MIVSDRMTQSVLWAATIFMGVISSPAFASANITKPASELPRSNTVDLDQDFGHQPASANDGVKAELVPHLNRMDAPIKVGHSKSRVIPKANIVVADPVKNSTKPDVKIQAEKTLEEVAEKTQPAKAATKGINKTTPQKSKSHAVEDDEATGTASVESNELRVEDVVEVNEVYKFAGRDKPDPFMPPIGSVDASATAVKALDADEIPIVSPLQYHALKALSVTGVWQGEDKRWKAMVETPDQEGIIAQTGDPIGNSGGHIADIGSNGVKVREYTLKKDGSREYTDYVIGMARETHAKTDDAGGKIILKPGVKTPEVHKAGPINVQDTEDVHGQPITKEQATMPVQAGQPTARADDVIIKANENEPLQVPVGDPAIPASRQKPEAIAPGGLPNVPADLKSEIPGGAL